VFLFTRLKTTRELWNLVNSKAMKLSAQKKRRKAQALIELLSQTADIP
jgi:hypothetical protein